MGMLTVHVRITDAGTGRPTPARLRITGPDGAVFFPFGLHPEFPVGRNEDVGGRVRAGSEVWCTVDGGCEVRLPAGVPLRVRVLKGPEFTPLDQTVTLKPGQMALRFAVSRWSDVRADGWHPGDTRAHFIPPHAARLEAAAEDLAVVNLLACETMVPGQDGKLYPSAPHLSAFSGQRPALDGDGPLVAVNTLNVHPVLGSVGLLHAHRIVFPLAFGGAEYPDDWSVCDWCDQCHRKNGLTVWANPFDPTNGQTGGEALVALILGKIDAVEFDGRPRKQPLLPWYYRLLNAGFHVPLVGGSGKDTNRDVLGSPRTYARLPAGEPLTYTAWIDAVRAGRCFATNGPLLRLTAGDNIHAMAECGYRFDRLELIADGRVVGTAAPTETDGRWDAGLRFTPGEAGWVAARCVGPPSPFAPDQPTFAHTAPLFVRAEGARRADAVAPLRAAVEQTREWVDSHGRFTEAKRKHHLLALCDAALAKLADAGATA